MPTTVGLHPHKAAVLARALRDTASGLRDAADLAHRALADGLDDPGLVVPVIRTARWAEEQAEVLQHVVDEVLRWELEGRAGSLDRVEVWRAPYDEAFDDPRAAMRAWSEARTLLATDLLLTGLLGDAAGHGDGRDDGSVARHRLGELLARFGRDPVFATALAASMDPERVVTLLRVQAEHERAGRVGDVPFVEGGALRDAVFGVLGVASASGTLPFGVDDLVRELRAGHDEPAATPGGADLEPLGLLFVPGSVWGAGFLVDAVAQIVVPLNRAGGEREAVHALGGVDPRVLVLAAVGRNPDAARAVLAEQPLGELVAEHHAYGDGGAALADVLLAGTDPARPDTRAQAAANMAAFVVFAVAHHDLPPVVRARLGLLATPWVASFRSTSRDRDDADAPNPLAVLTDDTRLRFLAVVASDLHALADLRQGELRWAAAQLQARTGSGFGPAGIALVANVDARVAHAVHQGIVDLLHDDESRIAFDKRVWSAAVAAFTTFIPLAGTPIGVGMELAGDALAPVPEWSLDYARAFPDRRDSDQAKLETLLVASLWARRAENGVFVGVEDPPDSVLVGEPRRLLFASEMTAAQLDQFRAWVERTHLRSRAHFEELTVGRR